MSIPASHTAATVLVVEDEAGLRIPIVRALRRQGHTVLEAEHGYEALAMLDAHGAPIDLLLTDLSMPGMHGTELAQRLRARLPGLGVIFMSGVAADSLVAIPSQVPRTVFLEKPFQLARLIEVVRGLQIGG